MIFLKRFSVVVIVLASVTAGAWPGLTEPSPRTQNAESASSSAREDAYRANNLGVALLEQFKYKEGAEAFMRALQIDPKLSVARINLAIALFNVPDLAGALGEAKRAAALNPNAPQPHYIMGLIAKLQNRTEESIAAFRRVLKIDPRDVGANVQLGQLYAQQRKYAEAIAAFRKAIEVEPYNATALYNLGIALTRSGERAEGQRLIKRFQELRQSGAGTVIGQNYLEQGRYSEAIASTGAEPDLVDRATPAVTFRDATASVFTASANAQPGGGARSFPALIGRRFTDGQLMGITNPDSFAAALGGISTLFDYDLDGDLDLFQTAPFGQKFYRNDGGKFVEVTGQSGALGEKFKGIGTGAVAGDYDNDGKPDLFVIRAGKDSSHALYHNDGNGKFSDATSAAGIPSYPYLSAAVAFVDVDHDHDLDIFIAGLADLTKRPTPAESNTTSGAITFPDDFAGAPNMLLRNDGNGKFTDVTATAKVAGSMNHAVAVVPTDYNNRRDIDLLVINYGKAPELFSNQRDGMFRNVAREAGLGVEGHWTSAAAGDVNKDRFTDFFFGRADGPGLFAISDGQGRFKTMPASADSESASAAQFLDYDGDGLLDLVTVTGAGFLRVLRNVGDAWVNVSERAVASDLNNVASSQAVVTGRAFAAGDLDGDGDTDLILVSAAGRLTIARNDGGNQNRSVRVQLAGRVSNRSGIGARIELRAGSLAQQLEKYSASPAPAPADVVFGLGKRAAPDAVRVLWPAGIVQAETEIATSAGKGHSAEQKNRAQAITLPLIELDRKPSSCPYLYAWNGERFEFITDFMGGGEMGYWHGPGHYSTPDPDEYVRIRGDQLREQGGRYELRVTNELEEALFIDRLQLIAVAHPQGVDVYPNEGLTGAPFPPFKLYATRDARPPVAAFDGHGHDVLSRIAHLDRQYPDDFKLHRIRGYSEEHTLTLKLDEEGEPNARTLLLLTGWTDYAFSSDNVAASHASKTLSPPALQVKDARGAWRTAIDNIGIPVGRPQTVPVDLTGKFPTRNREVRIITNMRIYWDQILVDTSKGDFPTRMTRLDAISADLHWRGYSRETSPDGREPFGYDYERVSFTSPWKVMAGRYTREGDVRALLRTTDDMFAISRTGDELSLSFNAKTLPPLPNGWTRTFLLYADGYSKEMDINSASPDQIGPLPFHGMTRYPYAAPETYPMTKARRAYIERYNTRVVAAPVPLLVISDK